MVTGVEQRQIDQRNGGLAVRSQDGVPAEFEFTDARSKFKRRRGTVQAISVADTVPIPMVVYDGSGGKYGRRATVDGGCERSVALRDSHVRMDEFSSPRFRH